MKCSFLDKAKRRIRGLGFNQPKYMPNYLGFNFGIGKIALHLHVRPNENTDNALFAVEGSVSLTGSIFGYEFRRANLLSRKEHWGLCMRMEADHPEFFAGKKS